MHSLRSLCVLCAAVLAVLCMPPCLPAQEPAGSERLREWVERRVRERPQDASAWRMLGKLHLKSGRFKAARAAFEKSVALDPLNAAARFDLGNTCAQLGQPSAARRALRSVLELAPDSEYAADARKLLADFDAEPNGVQQAGYEIREFDGTESIEPLTRDGEDRTLPKPFGFHLETGALYNSNVALAPLSRELSPSEPASAQGFAVPELVWTFIDRGRWRAGGALRGNFTLNEGNFRQFDLQSYQPGLFVESFHAVRGVVLVPRLAYDFTHDEFNGSTFGNRHALTATTWVSWNERDASLLFWTINYSDFLSDGIVPSITSQDGWTNTLGISHDHRIQKWNLDLVRFGADFTRADTRGSDYRFNGVQLFAEGLWTLTDDVDFKLRGGWGYRNYPDFAFSPSRNENIWRAGAELRKRFNDNVSVSLVFRYVRFDSRNPLFEAERFLAGLVTTIDY